MPNENTQPKPTGTLGGLGASTKINECADVSKNEFVFDWNYRVHIAVLFRFRQSPF